MKIRKKSRRNKWIQVKFTALSAVFIHRKYKGIFFGIMFCTEERLKNTVHGVYLIVTAEQVRGAKQSLTKKVTELSNRNGFFLVTYYDASTGNHVVHGDGICYYNCAYISKQVKNYVRRFGAAE